MDDPANGGVSKGSCLLTKENSTFLSDYGPCSNLSSTVYIDPSLSSDFFSYLGIDRRSDIDLWGSFVCVCVCVCVCVFGGIYTGWIK